MPPNTNAVLGVPADLLTTQCNFTCALRLIINSPSSGPQAAVTVASCVLGPSLSSASHGPSAMLIPLPSLGSSQLITASHCPQRLALPVCFNVD